MNALSIRSLAVRLLTPLSWRLSRRRVAASLRRFSEVEADSAWQMLVAMEEVPDPEFKAELFNNALEEVHHAYLFKRIARRYEDHLSVDAVEERQQLFNPAKGLVIFEAYHYVGEADVFRDFLAYAGASPHEDVRDTFMAIRGDEEEHQKLAYNELVRQCGSEKAARRLIRGVRLSRAWDGWVRGSRKIGEFMSSVLLMILYFTLGLFLAPLCRARLRAESRLEARLPAASPAEAPRAVVS